MKKAIGIVLLCATLVGCQKGIDLPLKRNDIKCCETTMTEEVVFRDPGMCSGMWFERPCGDMLEVFNYFQAQDHFCWTPPLQPGDKVEITYQCYDDSRDIQCEALCAFEMECERKGIDITKVEVIHN